MFKEGKGKGKDKEKGKDRIEDQIKVFDRRISTQNVPKCKKRIEPKIYQTNIQRQTKKQHHKKQMIA